MDSNTISVFRDEYAFLSNMYMPARVVLQGLRYPSTEHAYQAAKFDSLDIRQQLIACRTGYEAKKMARKFASKHGLTVNWKKVRVGVMRSLTYDKYHGHYLQGKLLSTGEKEIIEGNIHHDNFWGDCVCGREKCLGVGENNLGKVLMEARTTFRERCPYVVEHIGSWRSLPIVTVMTKQGLQAYFRSELDGWIPFDGFRANQAFSTPAIEFDIVSHHLQQDWMTGAWLDEHVGSFEISERPWQYLQQLLGKQGATLSHPGLVKELA